MLIFLLIASAINVLYMFVYYKGEAKEIELIASFGEHTHDWIELEEKIERHKKERKERKGFLHNLELIFAILTPGFLIGCTFYVAIKPESEKLAGIVLIESSILGFFFNGLLHGLLCEIMNKTFEAADREIKYLKKME